MYVYMLLFKIYTTCMYVCMLLFKIHTACMYVYFCSKYTLHVCMYASVQNRYCMYACMYGLTMKYMHIVPTWFWFVTMHWLLSVLHWITARRLATIGACVRVPEVPTLSVVWRGPRVEVTFGQNTSLFVLHRENTYIHTCIWFVKT